MKLDPMKLDPARLDPARLAWPSTPSSFSSATRGSSRLTSARRTPVSADANAILATRPVTPAGSHVHETPHPAFNPSKSPPRPNRAVAQRRASGARAVAGPSPNPSTPTQRHTRTTPSLPIPAAYSPLAVEIHLAARRSLVRGFGAPVAGPVSACIVSAWKNAFVVPGPELGSRARVQSLAAPSAATVSAAASAESPSHGPGRAATFTTGAG